MFDSLIRRLIERAVRCTLRDLPHVFERVLQFAEPFVRATVFLDVFHAEAFQLVSLRTKEADYVESADSDGFSIDNQSL